MNYSIKQSLVHKLFALTLGAALVLSAFPASVANAQLTEDPLECIDIDENLITNGSFESPAVDEAHDWDTFTAADTGWSVRWMAPNGDAPSEARLEFHRGVDGWTSSGVGSQYTELDSDYDGPEGSLQNEPASVQISQVVAVEAGATYKLSWLFSARPDTTESDNELEVKVFLRDSVVGTTNSAAGGSDTAWAEDSITFEADFNSVDVVFLDKGTPNSKGTFLDGVRLCKVAEPQTYTIPLKICKYKAYAKEDTLLPDWEINLTNSTGTETLTTVVDKCIEVEVDPLAGPWTVTEKEQDGWLQNEVIASGPGSVVITLESSEGYPKGCQFPLPPAAPRAVSQDGEPRNRDIAKPPAWQCDFFNYEIEKETITACKYDETGAPVSGWGMTITETFGKTNFKVLDESSQEHKSITQTTEADGCTTFTLDPNKSNWVVTEEEREGWNFIDVEVENGDETYVGEEVESEITNNACKFTSYRPDKSTEGEGEGYKENTDRVCTFTNDRPDEPDSEEEPRRRSSSGTRIDRSEPTPEPEGEVAGDSTSVPEGLVLGEQTSVVPAGAVAAGAGGSAPAAPSSALIYGIVAPLLRRD